MRKKRSVIAAVCLMICLVFANLICNPDAVSAKELSKISQAKKLAKKQVKGATVIKAEKDDDDGVIVYEVKLSKGKKLYDLIYRASDSKLISYDWEIKSRYIKKGAGKAIGTSKCKRLAKKQVPGAGVKNIVQKYDDGISVYKVKMQKSGKKYELRFHALTGKLLEYEWELTAKAKNSKNGQSSASYIGEEKAVQIALAEAGGGTVVKLKFEVDDGVPVYEIDIRNGNFEYEFKIHAKTGKILEMEQEPVSGNEQPPQENADQITLEAAKEIAAADAGVSVSEVTYTKAKLDREDGVLVYEIEFCTATHKYEYEINASTGAVSSKKKEILPGGGNIPGGTEGNDIGIEAAKQIALAEAGGVKIEKAELEFEDGISVYEVKIKNGEYEYEIKIDARTGKVLEVEVDPIS